jgi:hypothetical protein
MVDRCGDQRTVGARLKASPQIVFPQIIGGDIASEQRGFADVMNR